jgi:hypothetical protein
VTVNAHVIVGVGTKDVVKICSPFGLVDDELT